MEPQRSLHSLTQLGDKQNSHSLSKNKLPGFILPDTERKGHSRTPQQTPGEAHLVPLGAATAWVLSSCPVSSRGEPSRGHGRIGSCPERLERRGWAGWGRLSFSVCTFSHHFPDSPTSSSKWTFSFPLEKKENTVVKCQRQIK